MANSRLCSIEGCEKSHYGFGYCRSHYERLKRHGDPLAGRTPDGEPKRFLDEVALPYQGDDCLTWPFAKRWKGYGIVLVDGKHESPHRYICRLSHGDPPAPEHEAAHNCGNGHLGCVNPRHMEWKTPKENAADRLIHGTHSAGEKNGNARLTEAQVREILALRGTTTQASIARRYGVTPQTIYEIYKGKTWACLHEGDAQ